MKEKILRWIGFVGLDARLFTLETDKRTERLEKQMKDLEEEVRESMKYIGALYEYLEVRPERTFVQDFSRLPQEEHPTMEIIKLNKKKK